MHFIKLNNYIEDLDMLIRQECTGTAGEFARKLGISERTLQNHLQQLREIGIEVVYDHFKKTYKYPISGRIVFGFTPDDMNKIRGGNSTLNSSTKEFTSIPFHNFSTQS